MTAETTPPDAAQVMRMARGYMMSQVVYVAAKLGLADLIAAGTTTTAHLASATGTDPDALERLLRALGELGLVTRDPTGGYALAPAGEYLCDGHAGSVRHLVIMSGEEHYQAWSQLLHSVHTGTAATERALGRPVFAYLAAHPEAGVTFHRAMAELAPRLHIPALSTFDFSRSATVVDVGGGTGSLLRHLLRAHPHLRGVLFDLPEVVAGAVPELRAGDLADRCQLVGGDFFEKVPGGGDTYLMSIVLHDYDDVRAGRLLGNVRDAVPPDGRLVVLEGVLPERDTPHLARLNDLNMLVMSGGRERTAAEYDRLLAGCGFRLDRIDASSGPLQVLLARPV